MYRKELSTIMSIALTLTISIFPAQSYAEATSAPAIPLSPASDAATYKDSTISDKYLDINPNQWFYPFVDKIQGLSLLTAGVPLLKPYEPITLEEVYMLIQAQDSDITDKSEAIRKSRDSKLLDENADLNRTSTRDDLYTAVGRYYGIESTKKLFSDTTSIYANGLLENNIITPLVQNNKYVFSPKRTVTRAEAIVLIARVKQFKKDAKSINPVVQKPVYLPVLIYHEITEDKDKLSKTPGLFVSPSKFKQDVEAFQKNGFTAVTFEDVKAFMDGYATIPEKPYIITFDDGYKGNFTYGFPTAKELNTKFVVNLVADSISRSSTFFDAYAKNQHLSEKEIWDMHTSGLVEFQSHTYNLHKDFGLNNTGSGMNPFKQEPETEYWSRVQDDLQRSAGVIRYLTGYTPCALTYPMGMYNGLIETIASKNGYTFTLTIEKGVNNLQNGTNKLKRINVNNYTSSEELVKLAGTN